MRVVLFINLLLEIVKYILAGEAVFNISLIKRYRVGLIAALSMTILAVSINDKVEILSFMVLPIIFVILFITMGGNRWSRVTCFVKLTFLILYMDYVIELFMKLFASSGIKSVRGWLISNVISISLYGSIYVIRRYKSKVENTRLEQIGTGIMYAGIVMMAVAIPLTIAELNILSKKYNDMGNMKMIQLLSAMSMLGIVILGLVLIYIYGMNQKMKSYLEIERMLKQTQKNYYEAVIEKEENTKKFRHDISNHIMCIGELAEQGKLDEVRRYIDDIQIELKRIHNCCYSVGNTIIDALLNRYVSQLSEDVKVTVSGAIHEQLPISDVEFCTIFSNLMKNSVEALQHIEGEKYLSVKFYTGSNDFVLELCNSASNQTFVNNNGLPETTKIEKDSHGYGLQNVKDTINKNNGKFYWESSAETFKVKVLLPNI